MVQFSVQYLLVSMFLFLTKVNQNHYMWIVDNITSSNRLDGMFWHKLFAALQIAQNVLIQENSCRGSHVIITNAKRIQVLEPIVPKVR